MGSIVPRLISLIWVILANVVTCRGASAVNTAVEVEAATHDQQGAIAFPVPRGCAWPDPHPPFVDDVFGWWLIGAAMMMIVTMVSAHRARHQAAAVGGDYGGDALQRLVDGGGRRGRVGAQRRRRRSGGRHRQAGCRRRDATRGAATRAGASARTRHGGGRRCGWRGRIAAAPVRGRDRRRRRRAAVWLRSVTMDRYLYLGEVRAEGTHRLDVGALTLTDAVTDAAPPRGRDQQQQQRQQQQQQQQRRGLRGQRRRDCRPWRLHRRAMQLMTIVLLACGTLRIGEASNPGPRQSAETCGDIGGGGGGGHDVARSDDSGCDRSDPTVWQDGELARFLDEVELGLHAGDNVPPRFWPADLGDDVTIASGPHMHADACSAVGDSPSYDDDSGAAHVAHGDAFSEPPCDWVYDDDALPHGGGWDYGDAAGWDDECCMTDERTFADEIDFFPMARFDGKRANFVYKLGVHGLGYYRDSGQAGSAGRPPPNRPTAVPAAGRARW